jgi:hypothetical protein
MAWRSVHLATVFGGAVAACGPSFQAIYEGNARFEHCYALEENAQTDMPAKAACWRDWSEHYTYGQTRDRINYATARYVALTEAGSAPTDEALMMAAPGETPRATTITAPAPTNAFAPPPKVLEPTAQPPRAKTPTPPQEVPILAVPDAGAAPIASPPLPGASCGDGCGASFQRCNTSCEDAGPRSCTACAAAYRGCMRGCFR